MKNSNDAQLQRCDLVRAARDILERRRRAGLSTALSLRELAEMAVASQPRAYFINYDRASALVHAWRRGAGPRNRELRSWAEDIDGAVASVQAARPSLKFAAALAFVLMHKRPGRFYISVARAQDILSPYFEPRMEYVGGATIS